ncbi:MAG: hypothetical protein JO257_15825 [Deltaproteobacteria bacterium]|nr:hypothetical protein [Deltaproteobacteria bacterium]
MFALPYIAFIRLHRAALDARRRVRTWQYYAYSVAAGLLAGLLVGFALFASYYMVLAGVWYLAAIIIAFFVVPPLQPVLQRHVLVPLGAVRTSFWIAHFVSMKDSDAFALCCAAWAHAGKPTGAGEAWIIERRDKRRPLGDAEIVVTAFLAAGRGDAATCRDLLRSLDLIVENHPNVREVAGEWLAVDAADRGAWGEIAASAAVARYPASALTFLIEGIAAARTGGAGAPGAGELRARWLLAPHRRVTLGLLPVDVAAEIPVRPAASEPPAETPPERPPLPRAVAAHLHLANRAANATGLALTVQAWDAALSDPATRDWLARRALELDAPLGAADRALRDVASDVTDELARLAEAAGLGAPPAHGLVGDALARRLRHGRLDALEAAFTRWAARRHDGAVRAPIDEWREFCALRTAYDAAATAGGLELRRLAFPHAYSTGNSMAVWLWNTRSEYALSHAISRWLLAEALTVGDAEAIDLCSRNCKLSVPTRTGTVKG